MTDRTRERLKNQGVNFTRDTAKVQLERAHVTLSPEWTRQRDAEPSTEATDAPEPLRRAAGGG
jgi:hypothetical protein